MDFGDLAIASEYHDNSGSDSDADDLDETEINSKFSKSYRITAEKAVTLNKNYILHISCTNETEPKICVGLSDYTCEIYNFTNNQIIKTDTLDSHTNTIVNVKFNSNNLLYTGSSDGTIKLWDLRTPKKSVLNFTDNTQTDTVKPLSSFDVATNDLLVCGGTELFEGDAFLLFWDVRKADLLGGYWESHTDDITKVLFHPEDNNKLATGSTDGLINIFDLQNSSEEDALVNSLNTDSSVEQLLWYKYNNTDAICCITHTTDIQLWDTDEATLYKAFSRKEIAAGLQRKSADHCYIANAHSTEMGDVFLLAGSNWHNGECVRGLNISENENLRPKFRLIENKQRIRASWYNNAVDMLITGGEQSILSVWQPKDGNLDEISPIKNTKHKRHLNKPY